MAVSAVAPKGERRIRTSLLGLQVRSLHDVAKAIVVAAHAGLELARGLLEHFKTTERDSTVKCEARVVIEGQHHALAGAGNGPIDAFVRALGATQLPKFDVVSYSEHSLGAGAEAKAVSYIQVKMERGAAYFGAGIDTNIELASIKAIVSALNRALKK